MMGISFIEFKLLIGLTLSVIHIVSYRLIIHYLNTKLPSMLSKIMWWITLIMLGLMCTNQDTLLSNSYLWISFIFIYIMSFSLKSNPPKKRFLFGGIQSKLMCFCILIILLFSIINVTQQFTSIPLLIVFIKIELALLFISGGLSKYKEGYTHNKGVSYILSNPLYSRFSQFFLRIPTNHLYYKIINYGIIIGELVAGLLLIHPITAPLGSIALIIFSISLMIFLKLVTIPLLIIFINALLLNYIHTTISLMSFSGLNIVIITMIICIISIWIVIHTHIILSKSSRLLGVLTTYNIVFLSTMYANMFSFPNIHFTAHVTRISKKKEALLDVYSGLPHNDIPSKLKRVNVFCLTNYQELFCSGLYKLFSITLHHDKETILDYITEFGTLFHSNKNTDSVICITFFLLNKKNHIFIKEHFCTFIVDGKTQETYIK